MLLGQGFRPPASRKSAATGAFVEKCGSLASPSRLDQNSGQFPTSHQDPWIAGENGPVFGFTFVAAPLGSKTTGAQQGHAVRQRIRQ